MPVSSVLVTKTKVQLKLAIARLRMVQHRDEALSKQQRRAMAQLLDVGKEESARIRVENIIRSDITVELYEILELYCELLLARAGLLETAPIDPGLEEAAKSIVYAAPKTEIRELQQVRALLAEKFGKEFVLQAMENSDGRVSPNVVKKLSVTPPREELVRGYLEEIAKTYGVNWPRRGKEDLGEPPAAPGAAAGDDEDDDDNPSGGVAQKNLEAPLVADPDKAEKAEELSKATPPRAFGPASPLQVNPPSPSTDNLHPKVTLNSLELKPNDKMANAAAAARKASLGGGRGGGGGGGGSIADGIPDVDELSKRFAALKR